MGGCGRDNLVRGNPTGGPAKPPTAIPWRAATAAVVMRGKVSVRPLRGAWLKVRANPKRKLAAVSSAHSAKYGGVLRDWGGFSRPSSSPALPPCNNAGSALGNGAGERSPVGRNAWMRGSRKAYRGLPLKVRATPTRKGADGYGYGVIPRAAGATSEIADVVGIQELACGGQAFIATSLFDPSMSALPIIPKQNSGPWLVDTVAGCRYCTATQPGSREAKAPKRHANLEWSYPVGAHVTRGKVWAVLVIGRLRYVLNPREIELGRRAPAVRIYPGASEPRRKCRGELGTLERFAHHGGKA
ncbi:hypothetical protein Daesc_009801 [Daldinia eschscholtzii]|uniref:Uncharacterized protein n=1 Tax=Daldinia eschscholtzii TaxID=292717 RepID=A0AAX6M6D6_9PEZI